MPRATCGTVFVLLEPCQNAPDFDSWRLSAFDTIPGLKDKYFLSATDIIEGSRPYRYMNAYEVEDIHRIDENLLKSLVEGAKDYISKSEWQIYERLQYDERDGLDKRPAGSVLIFVGQTPKNDPEVIADFHRWYVEQHIGHLRLVPGWRTGSRYKLSHQLGDKAEYVAPFAAVHQYDKKNGLGGPEWKESVANPWTKKIQSYMSVPNHRREWKCDQ